MSKRFQNTGGREAVVHEIPNCDLCTANLDAIEGVTTEVQPAAYDGATRMGPWAYMCEAHFKLYGVGLGEGQGQKLFTTDI